MKSTKEVAEIIRGKLKKEFPNCKFSVTTKYYSMGSSITVALMAAPFDAILKKGRLDPETHEFIEDPKGEYYHEQHAQINHHYLSDSDYHKEYLSKPDGYNNGAILSWEAWKVLRRVAEIDRENNWDNSDPMMDYYDVHHHFDLEIGKYDKPFQKIEKKQIEARAANPQKAKVSGISITKNKDKNGIEIRFPDVPSADMRGLLKAHGFRWSRKFGCWWAKDYNANVEFANMLKSELS